MTDGGAPMDEIRPFQIADTSVRGRYVRLGPTIDEILKRHAYPPSVSELVGEAAVLTAVLGASLKFDGKLVLQIKSDGPVGLLVADYRSDGALRACATFDAEQAEKTPASGLLGEGHFALTIDQGPDMERYQGIAPLEGDTLADAALGYFAQSEQIPTAVQLAVGRVQRPASEEQWRAGGLLIQHMPSDGGRERGEAVVFEGDDEEDWRRAQMLLDTAGADEILDPNVSADELLYRLYHEDGVRVYDPQPVRFECPCSEEKIKAVLRQYPIDELQDMARDGKIHAKCEFCSATYSIAPNEIKSDED